MKLIYCPECRDVVKLAFWRRACECGSSYGYYEANAVDAVYGGSAVPLGFATDTLIQAVCNQPWNWDKGERFEAFTIPKSCPTFKKEK